jgi:YbbR domain-containing protein
MKKKDAKFFEKKWVLRGVSLLVALLLFAYVYSENYGLSTINRNSSISTSTQETISNVPIQVDINTDRYFISGLPETVVLTLKGPQSVLMQTISAADYRVVTEDLNALGAGEHTVQLRVENLSNEIEYQLTPSRVNVVIEERVSIKSPVELRFDESLVNPAYNAGNPVLSANTVTLTGPASTIARVKNVYVIVPAENGLTNSINMNTVVQVEDSDGNKLNVSVEPQEVNVKIPITLYGKKVPLIVQQVGVPVENKQYAIEISGDDVVTLTGDRALLEGIDQIALPVSVTGVAENKTQTIVIPLPSGSLTATPVSVEVTITVKDANAASTAAESSSVPTASDTSSASESSVSPSTEQASSGSQKDSSS